VTSTSHVHRRRALIGLTCCAITTTGLVEWSLKRRSDAPTPPQVEILVDAGGRGSPVTFVSPDNDVTIRARAANAVWIYRKDILMAVCPGPACVTRPGDFELTLRLTVPGRHRVVAVSGPRTVTFTGTLDADVLGARTLGAHLDLAVIDVIEPH
jgi:hypothetical protein